MAVGPSTEGIAPPEAELTHALYEEYAAQIFRYCLHQLGSREEAEDAVQSTFLNAFRGIKRGVVPELESAWLFKIAHNVCLSRRRSSWRRGRVESPADFELVEELAPAPSRRADELIGLQDVLEQMPEQQRRAILLREWQGLSYREIAEELELSQAAVETLIFRGRRALAQGLQQPPAPARRKRLAGGVFANLLSSAQSFLLGGGAAVKVAATVAVVSAGTVVATAPVQQQVRHHAKAPKPVRHAAAPAQHVRSSPAPAVATPVSQPVHAAVRRPVAVRHAVEHAAPPVAQAPVVVVPQAPAPEPAPAATTPAPIEQAPPAQQPQPEQPAQPTSEPPAQHDNGSSADKGQEAKKTKMSIGPEVTVDGTTPATTFVPPGQAKKQGDDVQPTPAPTPTITPAPPAMQPVQADTQTSVQPETQGKSADAPGHKDKSDK